MPWIVREVGVHLTDDVEALLKPFLEPVDVRPAQTRARRPVDHLDAPRMFASDGIREFTRAVRRGVVDNHHRYVRMRHQPAHDNREVVALVERGNDDERGGCDGFCHERPSNRSDEICSETRPTSRITTLRRIRSTEEFVTCDCVAIVHAA